MNILYAFVVALFFTFPDTVYSQGRVDEALFGWDIVYGDPYPEGANSRHGMQVSTYANVDASYSRPQVSLSTFTVSGSNASIYGATSVSPGTVRVNPVGTPSHSEDWLYLLNALDTPDKVSSYIVNNFTYSAHGSDTPYSPRELNELRAGDCKDFAAFSGAILSAHGYKGNQISFGYAKNLGHAATIYFRNGSDWVMSNGGIYGPVQNPTDLGIVARQIIEAPPNYSIGPIIYFPLDYFGPFSIGSWSP